MFRGESHQSHVLVDVEALEGLGRCETTDCDFGLLQTVLAHQPPGRFGGEEDTDEQGNRPEPPMSGSVVGVRVWVSAAYCIAKGTR